MPHLYFRRFLEFNPAPTHLVPGHLVPGHLVWFVDKHLLKLHFMQSFQRIQVESDATKYYVIIGGAHV